MSDTANTVRCAVCATTLPRLAGTNYPDYHLMPGSPPTKCPGSVIAGKPVKPISEVKR